MGRVHKKKIAEYVAASENDEEKNDVDSDAAVSEDEAAIVEAEAEESGEDLTAEPEPDTPEKEAAKKLKKRHAESVSGDELNGTSAPKKSKKAAGKKQKGKKPSKTAAIENDVAEEDANDEEEEAEYEVKEVVDHKVEKGKTFYLIRWKGYTADDDTWEAADSLSCPELIEKYNKKSVATPKKSKGKSEAKNKPGPKSKTKKSANNKKGAADPDQEWEVDKIIDYAEEDGGRLFLIRWKGYAAKHDTWEPEENLHCEDIIAKFMKRMKSQENVSFKELRGEPKKTKRLVSETTSRARFYTVSNHGDRKSKRATGKKRVFYGSDSE